MNINLFTGLVLLLGIVYSYIGYRASRTINSLSDYFLAGRSVGIFGLTIALIATQLGGGAILGTSKESFSVGIYGLSYIVSICIGFLLLACGIAQRLRAFNVTTTAELFEKKYKSVTLKKIASLLSIISLCGLLTAQIVASKNLMLSLNVYSLNIFLIFWIFVIGYTMVGGLRAVVNNDIFQLAFIIVVFVSLFFYDSITSSVGIMQVFTTPQRFFAQTAGFTWQRLLAILIIPACYSLIEQDIAQTIFAARSPRIAVTGSFLAAIGMMLFACIPVYFGMKAKIIGLAVPEGANPLLYLFDQNYSPFIVLLVVYGIFAAIISTADALLCAISSHIVQDFSLEKYTTRVLVWSKIIMGIVGVFALCAASLYTNIIDVIVGSYDIPVVTLFIPLIISYYTYKVSVWGAYASIICGLASLVIFKYFAFFAFSPEVMALAISCASYYIGALVEKFTTNKNYLRY